MPLAIACSLGRVTLSSALFARRHGCTAVRAPLDAGLRLLDTGWPIRYYNQSDGAKYIIVWPKGLLHMGYLQWGKAANIKLFSVDSEGNRTVETEQGYTVTVW